MASNTIKLHTKLLYAYPPLVMLYYYLAMHGINIYSFVIVPLLTALILCSISLLFREFDFKRYFVFVLFLIYNILSFASYAYNGRPLECYLTALRLTVFPMIFYLFAQDESDNSNNFYHYLLYACVFCFIVGLYLYIVGPDYYKTYLMTARENVWYSSGSFAYQEADVLNYSRMSSFFGSSYNVCFFSVPALIISLMLTLKKNESIQKGLLYFFAVICWISSIVCFQRVAMVSGILFILFYLFYSKRYGNKTRAAFTFTLAIFVIFCAFFLLKTERGSVIYELLLGRVEVLNFSDAMSERSGFAGNALNNWNDYLLGSGIGSFSHVAMRLGYPAVTDLEFVRILTENGIVGAILFAALVLSSLYRGLKSFSVYGIEVCIVLFFLLACIGANALSLSYVFSPVFWYALGHIQNRAYKQRYIFEQATR